MERIDYPIIIIVTIGILCTIIGAIVFENIAIAIIIIGILCTMIGIMIFNYIAELILIAEVSHNINIITRNKRIREKRGRKYYIPFKTSVYQSYVSNLLELDPGEDAFLLDGYKQCEEFNRMCGTDGAVMRRMDDNLFAGIQQSFHAFLSNQKRNDNH